MLLWFIDVRQVQEFQVLKKSYMVSLWRDWDFLVIYILYCIEHTCLYNIYTIQIVNVLNSLWMSVHRIPWKVYLYGFLCVIFIEWLLRNIYLYFYLIFTTHKYRCCYLRGHVHCIVQALCGLSVNIPWHAMW